MKVKFVPVGSIKVQASVLTEQFAATPVLTVPWLAIVSEAGVIPTGETLSITAFSIWTAPDRLFTAWTVPVS